MQVHAILLFLLLISVHCNDQLHRHHGKANEYMHRGKFEALVKRFESKERDHWQRPKQVIQRLKIKPGMTIGDVGAGTGYFTRLFASAVGKRGLAVGLDVDPRFIALLKKDSQALDQYTYGKIGYNGEGIDKYHYDLLFFCNVYHHIEKRIDYFKKLKAVLKPGARLVIVDFKKAKAPVGPPLTHKLAQAEVISELRAAGFAHSKTDEFLPWQYMLTFQAR